MPCLFGAAQHVVKFSRQLYSVQKFQSNSCSTENKKQPLFVTICILELPKIGVGEGKWGLSVYRLGNLTSGIPYSDCFIT